MWIAYLFVNWLKFSDFLFFRKSAQQVVMAVIIAILISLAPLTLRTSGVCLMIVETSSRECIYDNMNYCDIVQRGPEGFHASSSDNGR